jgi:DNA-binding CsgD family transcriptional regulator/tetratricopeptide (TPR) repeat protein
VSTVQLPGPLRLTPSFPFAGRSRELATLRALLPRAAGEGRRIALIGGEAGSGKSRLVRELAHEGATAGALVLYGACDAVVRTPYRPFAEALEQLVRAADVDELCADLGTTGGELARLLPDLSVRVGELPSPVAADPDTERHRLHTAVTDLLTAVSRRTPLLVIVEDGHWADQPTLLLLRHLGRAAVEARMLLLATFRDTEAEVPQELSDALIDLRRSEDVVRLHLDGLSGEEIAEFVRRATGADLGPGLSELASAIGEVTGGNAFLVTELWRTLFETRALLVEGDRVRLERPLSELGTSESVREVVSQRLARLAGPTTDLLEIAAVIGPIFELGVLERASSSTRSELLAGLDEALRNGVIEEVSPIGLVYRFTHELVRRAVSDRLTGIRRAEIHLRVGEAIEVAGAADVARVLPDLAYHFTAAAPVGDTGRAIDYNIRAARAAESALAYDAGAALLRTALELMPDGPERAELLLELGAASHLAGRADEALDAYAAVAAIARERGDSELLARAAIGFENACWRPAITDRGADELLEEAVEALGVGDSVLHVRVLSGLSRALANRGEHERATVVRTSAIAMARRIDDRHGLATVLARAYWAHGTTLEEVLAMLSEAVELAEELGDVELRAEAMEWRLPALIGLGDLAAARRELEQVLELGSTMGQPFILHVAEHYGSAIALCEGHLDEAERRAERSREWSRPLMTGRDPSGVYGVQMFGIRREQGRLVELAPVVRVLAGNSEPVSAWGPGLAALLAELGMVDETRRTLAGLLVGGLEPLRESLWLASLTYLTDAAAAVGDQETAALVYPELEPLAGRNVMIGYGVASYGAADRYLGMLAATLGDWQLAEEHFVAAVALNQRMGARTWLAHTDYEFGRMLLARGRPEDRARAASLLATAGALAEEIGLAALLARIQALGSPVPSATALPDGLSPREVEILRLVARGLSNREIGAELTISEHTAANHVRSILRKTGSANRTEAASYAHRRGLVER